MSKINLSYHNSQDSGYGRFGLRLAEALYRLGVENAGAIHPEKIDATNGPLVETESFELAKVALWLSTPPHAQGWYMGQFAGIFTMWESTEIPAGFRENLHHFDRIFVPSQQNLEIFSKLHPDVRLIPLGIDPTWAFRPRPRVANEFVFLTAGFGPRKGTDQVIKAFQKAFPRGLAPERGGPIPRLIVKSRDDVWGTGVTRISEMLSPKAELALYADAHCFVSGSKGEGWGFMPFQAIAQGCPTILGAAHGHEEFAGLGIPIETHPFRCETATFWGDGGHWWEPDFDQMVEAMRDVYANYPRYARDAEKASPILHKTYTWENTATQLLAGLDDVIDLEPPPFKVWRGAPPRLFHIRVNKFCAFAINGVHTAFYPGKDYWEPADIRRAILASGHMDLSVFDPSDLGMEDGDIAEEARAHNERCPTCHQRYNIDPDLAELRS
jgi:hypothetical protein